jgi:hypothetical protein
MALPFLRVAISRGGDATISNYPIGFSARYLSSYASYEWDYVQNFWANQIRSDKPLPSFVRGDADFGLTDLKLLGKVGEAGEFRSKDSLYQKRRTFAIRVGYQGKEYPTGFQRQKGLGRTVEHEILEALDIGKSITTAGRTDGGVSAVSQVISFVTMQPLSALDVLTRVRKSEACQAGRLEFSECYRVPRSFNARASAKWRRYLFLIPLVNQTLDTSFIGEVFRNVEGVRLPYNSFAFGIDRSQGSAGLRDECFLHRARVFEVHACVSW